METKEMKKKMAAAVIYKTTDSSDRPVLIGVTDSLEKAERIFSYSVYEEAKKMYGESGLQPEISYWGPEVIEVIGEGGESTTFCMESAYTEDPDWVYLISTTSYGDCEDGDIMILPNRKAAFEYFKGIQDRKGQFADLEDGEIQEVRLGSEEEDIWPYARLDYGKGLVEIRMMRERFGKKAEGDSMTVEV